MNSNTEIKSRIKSTKTIQKITKAMKLVATAKLQKNRKILDRKNEYFEVTRDIVNMFLNSDNDNVFSRIYKEKLTTKKKLFIVINSDLGFCGSFNTNLVKKMLNEHNPSNFNIVLFGKKTKNYLTKKDVNIKIQYPSITDEMPFDELIIPGAEIFREFNRGDYNEIGIYYNYFINSVTIEPSYLKLWPATKDVDNTKFLMSQKELKSDLSKYSAPISFEPSRENVAFEIFPRYLLISIYGACVMSKVSENSMRRLSMENATDNANDIINDLTYKYNRARQAKITQEIAEIVTGAAR